MSHELIAAVAAAILGLSGSTLKRFGDVEKRLNQIELNVASRYITKEEFQAAQDRLMGVLERFEVKLDLHVFGDLDDRKKAMQDFRRNDYGKNK
jgi:predicted regulator of Ras-like GTPase activity (Roadblock/LC7/MglB family)